MGYWREIIFHIILHQVLYQGSHLLQILLKALFMGYHFDVITIISIFSRLFQWIKKDS